MKKLPAPIIFLLSLIFQAASAQDGVSFYDLVQDKHSGTSQFNNNTFEKGDLTQLERTHKIWAHRIYPEGNFSSAYNANYQYTISMNRHEEDECGLIILDSKWEQLGPVGNTNNTPTVGQIHRITFHPGYDGIDNSIVYASSGFGGLWKSTDGASTWQLMNTDLQLPFCGVADVAVTYDDHVFAATGYPDGTIYGTLQPNVSSVNPLFTQGVYRTSDQGKSWNPVNKNLIDHFADGGVIRRIITDPVNSNKLLAASSKGIFYCEDALGEAPNWNAGLLDGRLIMDPQLRGIELKPGSSDTIFASGSDIYRSTDGGKIWKVITGKNSGLDLADLRSKYDDFTVYRINLAVTKLDPDLVYAYVMGNQMKNNKTRMFLYRYDGLDWNLITTHLSKSNFDLYSQSYMAIAVDPSDKNKVYWGNTIIHSTTASNTPPSKVETFMTYLLHSGGYVDIHSLVFEPVNSNPRLFAANHGGVSAYDFGNKKWSYQNTGICNSTIWSFDDNETKPDDIIIALQDHGIRTRQERENELQWGALRTGGDGYSARIYDDINRLAYHSNSYTTLYGYDFKTQRKSTMSMGFPKDIPDPDSRPQLFFTNSFPCTLHPVTHEPYLGFSEVYRRIIEPDSPKLNWQVESDLGKTIKPKWARQITELVIAPSNPDRVYLTTMGVDNGSNPKDNWHIEPRFFWSQQGFINGDWNKDHFEELDLNSGEYGIPKTPGNVKLPPITGIAVHPENENVLWVTFTGYSKYHKVYRSDDGGNSWKNEDPDACLHNLPVNGIAYQEGTDHRLYLATDAGVYTKDRGGKWSRLGNIPNVRVVEIKINYCNNTLKAATFGRGVFETALIQPEGSSSELVIEGSEIWDISRHMNRNIRIKCKGSLTINGDLMMPAGGRITIENKSGLYFSGGKITNACGADWDGIYLEGKKSVTNGIDEKTIEHSRHGLVRTKK